MHELFASTTHSVPARTPTADPRMSCEHPRGCGSPAQRPGQALGTAAAKNYQPGAGAGLGSGARPRPPGAHAQPPRISPEGRCISAGARGLPHPFPAMASPEAVAPST